VNEERFYCVSNGKTKGCVLYSKNTWIPLESGVRKLPSRALFFTAGAEAVLLHLFRVVLKKYSSRDVLMAVNVLCANNNIALATLLLLSESLGFTQVT